MITDCDTNLCTALHMTLLTTGKRYMASFVIWDSFSRNCIVCQLNPDMSKEGQRNKSPSKYGRWKIQFQNSLSQNLMIVKNIKAYKVSKELQTCWKPQKVDLTHLLHTITLKSFSGEESSVGSSMVAGKTPAFIIRLVVKECWSRSLGSITTILSVKLGPGSK